MTRDEIRTNTIAWTATGVSLIALILSMIVFNQQLTSRPVIGSDDLQKEVRQLQLQIEIDKVRDRLVEVRQQVEAGGVEANQRAQIELSEIRNNLRETFGDASEASRESWQQLDSQLSDIEIKLREGGVDVLNAIDRVLEFLKTEIRYD